MATLLPNRVRCHGNRNELAVSRVAHLQAFPILQLCVSHDVLSFLSLWGFFVFPLLVLVSLKKKKSVAMKT